MLICPEGEKLINGQVIILINDARYWEVTNITAQFVNAKRKGIEGWNPHCFNPIFGRDLARSLAYQSIKTVSLTEAIKYYDYALRQDGSNRNVSHLRVRVSSLRDLELKCMAGASYADMLDERMWIVKGLFR